VLLAEDNLLVSDGVIFPKIWSIFEKSYSFVKQAKRSQVNWLPPSSQLSNTHFSNEHNQSSMTMDSDNSQKTFLGALILPTTFQSSQNIRRTARNKERSNPNYK
jgi:hypothetical protein